MEISRSVNVCFLALLVILSGCFGLTDDEAEAADSDDDADDSSNGDTIVNNYYNNTTIATNEPAIEHIYSETTDSNDVALISVNQNQALEIVSAKTVVVWNDDYSNNYPEEYNLYFIDVSCWNSTQPYPDVLAGGFLWKGEGVCDYTIGTGFGADFGTSYSSIYYRIHTIG